MRLNLLAWYGSVALILGALYFQYFRGLDPCVLCIYQRIPHIAAIVLGVLAIWQNWRWAYPILALIVFASAVIALFHVGVEQHWWEGLQSCSGNTSGLSVEDLLGMPAARCDEIAWSFLGLSMAAWNMIASLVIAICWFQASKKRA